MKELTAEQAYTALVDLWNGKAESISERFARETGADYEQSLVHILIRSRYVLDDHKVDTIILRFEQDAQFYELAHLLLIGTFNSPATTLNESQRKVLCSLCENGSLWSGDGDLADLLFELKLPNNKSELTEYLDESV